MKLATSISLFALLTGAAACAESDFDRVANKAAGIYQVQSHTQNLAVCEPGGDSLLPDGADGFLIATKGEFFGTSFLSLRSCESPTHCREQVAKLDRGEPISQDFSYTLSGADGDILTGAGASTGFGMDELCVNGTVTDTVLSLDGGGLSLSQEVTVADDFPEDSDGFCTTDGAQKAAEGNECSEMTTLLAVFVEEL